MLERVDVSRLNRVSIGTGSSGCQLKWLKDNKFVKLSLLGYEHVAEVLTTWLLQCSDLSRDRYVVYHPCLIYEDNKPLGQGCYSESFLQCNDVEVSIANILDSRLISYSIGLEDLIELLDSYYISNARDYLNLIMSIDAITRNDDRHFRNISLIRRGNIYLPAPVFDNGGGCLSDIVSYPMNMSLDDLWKTVYAKPFSVTFGRDIKGSRPIEIRYDEFISHEVFAKGNPISERAYAVIKRGLLETEGLAWTRL